MAAQLRVEADGRVAVQGELGFASVPALLREGARLFAGGEVVSIDLAGVRRADSAGLALLVEWMRAARRAGKRLRLLNMPPQMLAIARVSGLDELLPLGRG